MEKIFKEIIEMAQPIDSEQEPHRLARKLIDNIILNFHEAGGSILFGFRDVEANGQPVTRDKFKDFIKAYASASGIDITPEALEIAVNYLHRMSPPQLYRNWKDMVKGITDKRERAKKRAADNSKREKTFDTYIQKLKN